MNDVTHQSDSPQGLRSLHPRMRSCVLASLATFALYHVGNAFAEDRVFYLLEGSGGRGVVSGTILDVAGKRITIRTGKGTTKELSTTEVLELETSQSDEHRAAKEFVKLGRMDDANASYQAALELEKRVWMRREIIAEMIRCNLRQGNYAQAGGRFLILLQSDTETSHFHLIPLKWSQYDRNPAWSSEAERWMELTQPAAKLMGASVLLDDAEHAAKAERVLDQLATDLDRRVAYLARMQLWRLRLQSGDITNQEPLRWQTRLDELPEDLRYGGYYLLGQAYLQQGSRDRAAAAFLWLPMTNAPDHRLSARAMLEAAESLEITGQIAEAENLYRDLLQRYADTPLAQDARDLLAKLQSRQK
ncbi:MAG: tetratricopeptide repeat protein [Planctomycetaceae bacterium]